jgi:hypothetical protein
MKEMKNNVKAILLTMLFITIFILLSFQRITYKNTVKKPDTVVLMYTWDDGSGDFCID